MQRRLEQNPDHQGHQTPKVPSWMINPENPFNPNSEQRFQKGMMKILDKMPDGLDPNDIVDMSLQFNQYTHSLVLVALFQGGTVASFEVEQNYTYPNFFSGTLKQQVKTKTILPNPVKDKEDKYLTFVLNVW